LMKLHKKLSRSSISRSFILFVKCIKYDSCYCISIYKQIDNTCKFSNTTKNSFYISTTIDEGWIIRELEKMVLVMLWRIGNTMRRRGRTRS
jgi:hypothetical protein